MRSSSFLFGLVALTTLALATSHANFRDVIIDLNALRDKAAVLGNHVHNGDLVVRGQISLTMMGRSLIQFRTCCKTRMTLLKVSIALLRMQE